MRNVGERPEIVEIIDHPPEQAPQQVSHGRTLSGPATDRRTCYVGRPQELGFGLVLPKLVGEVRLINGGV
jgi:hypothetical protein